MVDGIDAMVAKLNENTTELASFVHAMRDAFKLKV